MFWSVEAAEFSADLLDTLLPIGGDLVAITEAHFDESYEDMAPRVLCVAGYVFRKSRAIEFGKRWSRYLRAKGLPYFHANECAHSRGVFEGRTDGAAVERKLIELTNEYSDFGVAVSLDQDAYEAVCQGHKMFPTAYTYALTNCVYGIAAWRDRVKRTEKMTFKFEQGHAHADDAHRFISFMLRGDELPGRIGYKSHSFVPKETPQIQPGDLLAWLWRLHTKRGILGDPTPTRRDLIALTRPQDDFRYFDRSRIEAFRDSILKHSADAEDYVRELAVLHGMPAEIAEFAAKWTPDYRDARSPRAKARDVLRNRPLRHS